MAVAGTYVQGMLPSEPFFGSGFGLPLVVVDHADVSSVQVHQTPLSPTSLTSSSPSQHQQQASQTVSGASRRLSRRMDLLRWFSTIKGRRKEKDCLPCFIVDLNDGERDQLGDEFIKDSIVDVDLSALVCRPVGVEHNEWLATHTINFFEHVNIIYGCVSEFCWYSETCCCVTASSCPQYQWVDERGRRAKCSAAQYIDHVLSTTQSLVNDESIFPTKYGNKFPMSFESTVRKIVRLQVHVLSHVYRSHWQQLVELQLHPHFNTLVYHVMLFAKQFDLVDAKDSDALEELFERLRRRHSHATPPSSPPDGPVSSEEPAEQSAAAVQNSTALSS